MPLHRRLPKRGFTNIFAKKLNEVNLGRVQDAIEAGKLDPKDTVDSAALVRAGVLRRAKAGVRLLGSGEIKAKLNSRSMGPRSRRVAAVREGRRLGQGAGAAQAQGWREGCREGRCGQRRRAQGRREGRRQWGGEKSA